MFIAYHSDEVCDPKGAFIGIRQGQLGGLKREHRWAERETREVRRNPERGGTPKWLVPQNGWFIREDTINMDDLGKITEDSYGKSPFFNR